MQRKTISKQVRLTLTSISRHDSLFHHFFFSKKRGIVCCALAAHKESSSRRLKCLDGNAGCGVNGMLWTKYLGNDIEVTINPSRPEDSDIVEENLKCNQLNVDIADDNTCITLRKENYDFM